MSLVEETGSTQQLKLSVLKHGTEILMILSVGKAGAGCWTKPGLDSWVQSAGATSMGNSLL